MTMLAVDFNHWKTVSNWPALAASVDAIILKATQYTAYVDPTFAASLAAARKTGKCVGVYHFVGRNGMQTAKLPPGDPVAEANWFLSKYAHQSGEMVIVDYEPDAEPTDPDAWLAAHCARIIAVTGVIPVVYMNSSTASMRSWAKTRALGCALWAARYYANNGQISGSDPAVGAWGSFIGWQYTSNGSLPGISAQVDLSRFDLTAAQWRAFGGANKPPAPPAPPAPPVMEDDMPAVLRDPDGTIWLYTGMQMVRVTDKTLSAAQQKLNAGRIVDIAWPEVDALSADVDQRRNFLAASVWAYVKTTGEPLPYDRLVGIDGKTGTTQDAVAKLQSGGVDPAEVIKGVLGGLNGTTLNVGQPAAS